MSKDKPYEEREEEQQGVSEPIVTYTSNKISSNIIIGERDDVKCAISGEELFDRLRTRIKTLFK